MHLRFSRTDHLFKQKQSSAIPEIRKSIDGIQKAFKCAETRALPKPDKGVIGKSEVDNLTLAGKYQFNTAKQVEVDYIYISGNDQVATFK